LALHGEALAFADIAALTHYEEGHVKDALSDLREMFLQVNEVGEETTFQLGALTRAFVVEQSKKLDRYAALKERVAKYKRNFYPENPLLSRLRDRVEALVTRGYRFSDQDAVKQAYALAMDPALSPKISEDPRFMSLQAYVCLSQVPPRIDDARRLFRHAFMMKFEPNVEYLKKWFSIERNSGFGLEECLKIADFVSKGKRYDDGDKMWFLSRKGSLLYNRGKDKIYFSPGGMTDIEGALDLHLTCYYRSNEAGSAMTDKSDEYARNTGYFLFMFLLTNGRYDDFFRIALRLSETANNKLDPLEEPLLKAIQTIEVIRGTAAELNRLRGRLEYLGRVLNKPARYYDRFACQRIVDCCNNATQALSQRLAGLK
jgi:hypothetical protein